MYMWKWDWKVSSTFQILVIMDVKNWKVQGMEIYSKNKLLIPWFIPKYRKTRQYHHCRKESRIIFVILYWQTHTHIHSKVVHILAWDTTIIDEMWIYRLDWCLSVACNCQENWMYEHTSLIWYRMTWLCLPKSRYVIMLKDAEEDKNINHLI